MNEKPYIVTLRLNPSNSKDAFIISKLGEATNKNEFIKQAILSHVDDSKIEDKLRKVLSEFFSENERPVISNKEDAPVEVPGEELKGDSSDEAIEESTDETADNTEEVEVISDDVRNFLASLGVMENDD